MTEKDRIFIDEVTEEIERLKEPLKSGSLTQWEVVKTKQQINGLQMALDIFQSVQDDDYEDDWG